MIVRFDDLPRLYKHIRVSVCSVWGQVYYSIVQGRAGGAGLDRRLVGVMQGQPRRKPPPLWAHQVPEYRRSMAVQAADAAWPQPEPEPEPAADAAWPQPQPEPEPEGVAVDEWSGLGAARLVLGGVPRERSGARRKAPPLWAHQVPGASYRRVLATGVAAEPNALTPAEQPTLSSKRLVPRAVSPKRHRTTPQRTGDWSGEAPTDREAELLWWWDEEVRQQGDRLNLMMESVLQDFFAHERDRTVHFSGECMEVLPENVAAGVPRQLQRLVIVISKRALYAMHSPMPAAGQQWRSSAPRVLLRNITGMRVWSQSDEQLVIEYQQPRGRTARRMFLVSEGRRDQAIADIQKALKIAGRREVPVQVSNHALFRAEEGGAGRARQPTRAFTKDTYGDNPVREGDDSAELCFTTLIGMVSVLSQGIYDDHAHMDFAPTGEDFAAEAKEMFPAAGTDSKPPHRYRNFEFTTYAPTIFRRIRSLAGISENQYLAGITGVTEGELFGQPGIPRGAIDEFPRYGLPPQATLCPMFTNSKSGAFFFFTTDMSYLVKTVGPEEVKVLRDMLPDYLAHYERNPDSLINKIVGAYSSSLCKDPFIVMESTFPLAAGVAIDEVYDLKGSSHGKSDANHFCRTEYSTTVTGTRCLCERNSRWCVLTKTACVVVIFGRLRNVTGRAIKESERDAKVVIFKDNDFDRNPDRTFKLDATERE
jgi:hypothetical protein